jgi:deoxycytidylate deaminase
MTRKRYEIIATVFDKRGRVIGNGVNQYSKSHPLFKKFAIEAGESPEKIYIHAEFAACISAGKKEIHSILIQRFHNNGEMANAFPCKTCQTMLKAFGVKIIRYTSDSGIQEIKIEDLS